MVNFCECVITQEVKFCTYQLRKFPFQVTVTKHKKTVSQHCKRIKYTQKEYSPKGIWRYEKPPWVRNSETKILNVQEKQKKMKSKLMKYRKEMEKTKLSEK